MAKSKKGGSKAARPATSSTKRAAKPSAKKPSAKGKADGKSDGKPHGRPAGRRDGRPDVKPTVTPSKDGKKGGKPAVVLAPIVLPKRPAVEAPSAFRREYKHWKDVLISLRHRLLKEGSNLEEEGLKALEQEVSVDHMADFGSDSSEQETTLQLIESNSLSLRDVDDALKRIDAKSYGLCEECESLIPSARLGILPHARFCIECQSKREGMPA